MWLVVAVGVGVGNESRVKGAINRQTDQIDLRERVARNHTVIKAESLGGARGSRAFLKVQQECGEIKFGHVGVLGVG